jgi:hypothetical protein
VHFAAKRPDLFVAAGGMSSNIGARTLGGLGPEGEVHYQGSVPYQLAPNLDEVDLILDIGATCMSDVTVDLCATIIIDLLFRPDHLAFANRMQEVGHQGTFDYRETEGSHAWRWWQKWLEERDMPFIYERLARPASAASPPAESSVPETFRYRSIAPEFSVWGYEVTVNREPREFLDLLDVTVGGFGIQGSGTAVVVTAERYQPGAAYVVAGAGDGPTIVTADPDGRLAITVDLGASHTSDQFTEQADLAEAQGDYFVVRDVSIAELDEPLPWATDSGGGATSTGSSPYRFGDVADAGALPSAAGSGPGRVLTGEKERVAEAIASLIPGPRAIAAEREPQLVPTVLFVLSLVAGSAVWWQRRRHQSIGEV